MCPVFLTECHLQCVYGSLTCVCKLCMYTCVLVSLQMCVCLCVHLAFCPCRGAILRPSRSWGQRLWVSVTLLSSTEGLSDWWTDGSLVGMKVAVGTEGWATSWEESHMHAPIMPTNTPHRAKTREGLRVKQRRRPCLGRAVPNVPRALERFHAPISNEMRRPRHTHPHTHSLLGILSAQLPASDKKKHGTWWETEEQR